MALGALTLLSAVRFETSNSDEFIPSNSGHPRRLSIAKPTLVVRTESNVRKESTKKPDPPCVICEGSGRVNCNDCRGKGRANYVHLEMLPKGEWPKWCRTCGGSGLDYCSRCLGTGEYRYIMGFRFMEKHSNHVKEHHEDYQVPSNGGAVDLLFNEEQSNN